MKRVTIAIPTVSSAQNQYVSPHFGRAPLFTVVEIEEHGFRVTKTIRNEYVDHARGRGHWIIEELAKHGVEAVIVASIGRGAFHHLRSLGIKVYVLPSKEKGLYSLEEAVKMLIENKLSEALEPIEHGEHLHHH